MNFASTWDRASTIDGWLSEAEAEHLFGAALTVPFDEQIVEVGAYRGKSTILLASSGRKVVTIDPMRIGSDATNRLVITEGDIEALRTNLQSLSNVTWLRVQTSDAVLRPKSVGLIYIDGDHEYPAPKSDFHNLRPSLAPGARIAFHDYGEFAGVTRSVVELKSEGWIVDESIQDKMYIARLGSGVTKGNCNPTPPIADVQPTTVTGFQLAVLCHRFGRRGRAFAYSLASQQLTDVRLRLTVFYCCPEDAALVSEGCFRGRNPPDLHLIRISQQRIMERAMHFAKVELDPSYSHTVFLDADLWFPSNFWQQYALALEHERPAYWSCRLLNIEDSQAERLIETWDCLTVDNLQNVSNGIRHDGFNGLVGHFQCIPTGLLQYPEDTIPAVNRGDESFSSRALAAAPDGRTDRRIGPAYAFHLDHPFCWSGTDKQL
jgi:hypothetical protein